MSNFAQWVPGRIVSESIDPYHMTSVDYFEQWGREPAERILRHFDGGVIHIHGNGRHLLEAAATLQGLSRRPAARRSSVTRLPSTNSLACEPAAPTCR